MHTNRKWDKNYLDIDYEQLQSYNFINSENDTDYN